MRIWELQGYKEGSLFGFKATVDEGSLESFIVKENVRALTDIKLRAVYRDPAVPEVKE